ncbi:AMP-binding protein [Amycolatopsis sp. NPDC059090]|uniref:AMP-binding protein n=1 Tax=unclassified Amycolatopsis TaxID=2618356 RepID=UPI00366DB5F5
MAHREEIANARFVHRTMHGALLATARSAPDAPAIIETAADGSVRVVSYGGLSQRVDDYTAALDALGLGIGDRIVLESDTSGEAIALFLACATLGLPFIPVSPRTPDQRLRSVVDAIEPALHVQATEGAREIDGVATARFGPAGLEIRQAPRTRPRHRRELTPTDMAYAIFTSGTTGKPKGVVMSHGAIASFYRAMAELRIVTAADRVATTSPLQFDFALLDIGLALGSGAALIPVPRELLNWPRRFLHHLRATGASQVNGVPSIWRQVLRHEPELLAEHTHIRGVLFSGENFPLRELRELQSLLPHLRVVNCFGPTEAMAFSLTPVPNPVPADLDRLSIGFAYPGAEMLLVDERGKVVDAPGVVGEIHLRGPSLFSGYWDDPDATRAALVPDPLEPRSGQRVLRSGDLACRGARGELYFRGRADSQVKIRGNRVELGEVERRLLEFEGVAAAAAVVRPGVDEPVLVAFVVLEPGVLDHDPVKLGGFCKETLPDYMVPQQIEAVESLPLNHNGKLDRAALAGRAV